MDPSRCEAEVFWEIGISRASGAGGIGAADLPEAAQLRHEIQPDPRRQDPRWEACVSVHQEAGERAEMPSHREEDPRNSTPETC